MYKTARERECEIVEMCQDIGSALDEAVDRLETVEETQKIIKSFVTD